MQADEIISKAEKFSKEFIAKLKDPSEQAARKQTYFMDNQDMLKKYMEALQKIVASYSEDEAITDDDSILLDKATDIIDDIKCAIADFQKELLVNTDVTEEDATAVLNKDTIEEAMKTNKTTQDIAANMNAIAEQQKANSIPYNYVLVCDGVTTMIAAETKEKLNANINAVVESGNFKDIKLYSVSYTPVPLKKKTVLSV